jgi:hypothetical protein
VGYHDRALKDVGARYATPPLELPATYEAVSEAIDRAFERLTGR